MERIGSSSSFAATGQDRTFAAGVSTEGDAACPQAVTVITGFVFRDLNKYRGLSQFPAALGNGSQCRYKSV